MDFSLYKTMPLEDWINSIYLQNSICTPDDLKIEQISSIFGGEVIYLPTNSHARWIDDGTNEFLIVLNNRLDEIAIRGQFFHELCHPLRHSGNQKVLPRAFCDLQEAQAFHFQLYSSIPFYMVRELDLPLYEKDISQYMSHIFKVPIELATHRFKQIKARIQQEEYRLNVSAHLQEWYRKSNPENWSDETKTLFRLAIKRKFEKGREVVIR
ncbi:ImmA/IrrE family metallo-endopeptidase [Brevibacillus laterosporus]|uniref:ImmA/IrrE family metallo-endopeptidase n=1 Tax=Brevibacillus laterosporus TaxID=1465 RepID=UPI000E6BC8E9|nr:ImmA/IrrE family metallo-endopeptidase [Brevibacillus laterosporus]AYB40010.1 terminase [Brevibacillus laterosporus]MBM7108414.1 hypothetical protein [Brevibacillus laterosporus]